MRGLLMRLSALDADAETAVRVISYFDALVERRATPQALVRATSGLAQCNCGLELGDGRGWRFTPVGTALSGDDYEASVRANFDVNGSAGSLWLERAGGAAPLDDLIIERASLAARILLTGRRAERVAGVADPVLVETVLSRQESLADRCRALRQLGLVPETSLRVAAIAVDRGRDPAAAAVMLVARGRPMRSVYVANVGGIAAVLFQQEGGTHSPTDGLRSALRERRSEQGLHAGIRVGIGGSVQATAAERSWQQALLALRFAPLPEAHTVAGDPGEFVVDHDELGVLSLLAGIPNDQMVNDPDVGALNALGQSEGGLLDIATLEAYCRTGSLRQAAQVLHLHHSSVAARLARIEDTLGWHLDDPSLRFRAQFALWVRRLAPGGDLS